MRMLLAVAIAAALLAPTGARAVSGRFVLHRDRDVLCFRSPCPNWTGRNLATGEVVQFDSVAGAVLSGRSNPADAWARGNGVIVTGTYEAQPNELHIVWAPVFTVTSIEGPAGRR